MKIAIIGTHSTGKTTIINRLADYFTSHEQSVHILPEFARLCPFPINEGTTLEAQNWIQEEQIKQEAAIDHRKSILLCDRATLDNFAYMHKAANGADIHAYEKRAAAHMHSYDYIFKTKKLDVAARADGVRTTDQTFRDQIDVLIHHFLEKHHINFHLLPPVLDYDTHVRFMSGLLPTMRTVAQPA